MQTHIHGLSFKEDEAYFLWLCRSVGLDDPELGYLGVLRQMYDDEFSKRTACLEGYDENRIADGIELRSLYSGASPDGPCSVLELIVALAHRMSNDLGYLSQEDWFMEMMHNLQLDLHCWEPGDVRAILRRFRRRKYDSDGFGGLFPLREPIADQKNVEIWYQMQAYVVENF